MSTMCKVAKNYTTFEVSDVMLCNSWLMHVLYGVIITLYSIIYDVCCVGHLKVRFYKCVICMNFVELHCQNTLIIHMHKTIH